MALQLNLNRKIASPIVGEYSGEVLSPVNGRWTYDLPDLELKMDDVINYYIFVSFNGKGYLKDDLTFKVSSRYIFFIIRQNNIIIYCCSQREFIRPLPV